jgi:penicillin-binding protein 1A
MGTGARASGLKHPLGGKTGTTNDYTDAWFIGFSPSVTCGTWVGYDNRQSLGEKETGARAALPIWMDFMRAAIAGKPDEKFPTAGAPKKVLDVPVSKPGVVVQPKPSEPKEPDEDEPETPKASAPAAAPTGAGAKAPGGSPTPVAAKPVNDTE